MFFLLSVIPNGVAHLRRSFVSTRDIDIMVEASTFVLRVYSSVDIF